jgi:hypothetical protein
MKKVELENGCHLIEQLKDSPVQVYKPFQAN